MMLISFVKIAVHNQKSASQSIHFPESMAGLIYRAAWNKENQYVFVTAQGNILLDCKNAPPDILDEFRNGVYVKIKDPGKYAQYPKPATNPGAFDYQKYLYSRKIKIILPYKADQIQKIQTNEVPVLLKIKTVCIEKAASIRNAIIEVLQQTLGKEYASAAAAIITGDTGGIDAQSMQNYRDAGIAHIMAVSGTHAAFVLGFARFLTSRKWLHMTARKIISVLLLFLFAAIADFSPSVTRAVLQSAYLLMAPVFRRPAKAKNALFFACIIQIGMNAYVFYNSGFVLSYVAAASILWIKPPLTKRIRCFQKLPDGICTGIAVNIGMMPAMIYYFNSISPIGIIATVFASKLASVICMTGFAIWFGSYLPAGGFIVKIPAYLSSAALYILRKISIVGSGLPPPLGAFGVPGIRPFSVFLYYVLLLLTLYRKKRRFNLKRYIAAAACAGILLTLMWIRTDKTEILFFDVGQGFSALIRTRKICGLIDGGDGKTDISELLVKQGIGTLDFIILTHGHADHAAGIYDVIKEHTVRCILLPDNPYDEGAAAISEAAAHQNIEIIRVKGISEYTFGDLSARLCANEQTMVSAESSAVNNSSIVTTFWNQNGRVLFTGDIENETETYFAANQWIEKSGVLAVAHHGSDAGSLTKNISIILPEYAIISVGRNNSYGHPSVRVIETLSEVGAGIFRSDLCGAIKITMRKGRIYAWRKLTTLNI